MQHDVLQVGAAGLLLLSEVQRQAGIAPVEFRQLADPLAVIGRVRRKANEQIRRFEQVEVAVHRGLRQRNVPAEPRLIDDLAQLQACGAHEAAKVRQRGDRREPLKVAFEVGLHVPVEPDAPLQVRFLVDGGDREAAPACQASPVLRPVWLSRHEVEPLVIAGTHELFPDPAPTESPLLAPRHRPQTQIARASCQRLGNPSHEQQIRRSRQEEPARLSLPVDHAFHGVEQIGDGAAPRRWSTAGRHPRVRPDRGGRRRPRPGRPTRHSAGRPASCPAPACSCPSDARLSPPSRASREGAPRGSPPARRGRCYPFTP